MHYYILNSGHQECWLAENVRPGIVQRLSSLAGRGGNLPAPYDNFRVETAHAVDGALYTVWIAEQPMATCALAWTDGGATELWTIIEKMYYSLSDRYPDLMAAEHIPTQPADLPWLAGMFHPGFAGSAGISIPWLGDFNRCFAWTILEERRAWNRGKVPTP